MRNTPEPEPTTAIQCHDLIARYRTELVRLQKEQAEFITRNPDSSAPGLAANVVACENKIKALEQKFKELTDRSSSIR
jgi:hypothetical protein